VLGAGMLPTAPAVAAAVPPAVKVVADDTPWQFTTQPATIYAGQGGSPIATKLTWSSWGARSATATGTLYLWNPGCVPVSNCKGHPCKLTVWLHQVASHNGTLYFSRMRYSYGHRGKRMYWAMGPGTNPYGGSDGIWSQR